MSFLDRWWLLTPVAIILWAVALGYIARALHQFGADAGWWKP
jgi:hypothetical protein